MPPKHKSKKEIVAISNLYKSLVCFWVFVFLWQFPIKARSQNTLFDDSRLSSIYITIHPDSLKVIYDSVLSDHYFMAGFVFDDNEKRDTLRNIGFRLRGNTSRYAQKKSFKISFNEYVPGRKYQGVKKINLNGEHNDPTLIREKLFYDIWEKAGMVKRRTNFVRLYINQEYYGLYTNLEEMGKEWLSRNYQADTGNLYKCAYPADLVYHGDDQQLYKDLQNSTVTGGRVYELENNTSADDYSGLVELITVLNHIPDEQFAADIAGILDVDEFLKALAIDVATGNWDDYGYNRNNYYLYDNPDDGQFEFITYDPDNTFGIDWFGIDWATRNCKAWINTGISLPLAQKLLAVPAFFERYKGYLDTITRNIIDPDSIFPRIDSIKALIQQAAEEDIYRTLDYGYSVADFNDSFIKGIDQHTPWGLKPFLSKRQETILAQLNSSGLADNSDLAMNVRIFPNPASEYITIEIPEFHPVPLQIKIIDILGKSCQEYEISNSHGNRTTLPVMNLKPGVYAVVIPGNEGIFQERFIRK